MSRSDEPGDSSAAGAGAAVGTAAGAEGTADELELAEQLRVLDELEAEYRSGGLDEADYRSLSDDYTVRVADVMRRIDGRAAASDTTVDDAVADDAVVNGGAVPAGGGGAENGAATGGGPRPVGRRRIGPVIVVAVLVFAVGAGWLLARAVGERGVGDTLTGGVVSNRQRVFDCQELGAKGQIVESLQCLDQVLLDDPDNVEALAYRGWFVLLTTSSAEQTGLDEEAAELLEVGRSYLDQAVELDPTYPDARVFRSVYYDRAGEADAACAEVAALRRLDPPPFYLDQTAPVATRNGC